MSGFNVTPEWCQRARRSVEDGALEQLSRQRTALDLKAEFWSGYLAAIEELEEHIRRAELDRPNDGLEATETVRDATSAQRTADNTERTP